MRFRRSIIILLSAALWMIPAVYGQKASVPVTITVSDATGARVPHAKVRLLPAPDASSPMETDDAGSLPVRLTPGSYALFVRHIGFTQAATRIDIQVGKEAQPVAVVLQPHATTVLPAPSKDDLVILTYPYHGPLVLSPSEVKAKPHITVTIHNPHANADETYSGVRLADLLATTGVPLGSELRGDALADYVVATGSDGYQAVLALGEIDPGFHPGEVLVADSMDGKPLDSHSGPFKLVVTEDKRPARSVRNPTTIELKSGE